MSTRRRFLHGAAAAALAAPQVVGANDRLRVAIIGPGGRGQQLMKQMAAIDNVEPVAVADVYRRRHDEARAIWPGARAYFDYREMLDKEKLDAVLIATPQHLHAEHFVAAIEAGLHVYIEKTMAFTVDHAKRMRLAYQRSSGRVVQVGVQGASWGAAHDARKMLADGKVGKITELHANHYRNTPVGQPQWARAVPGDATLENIRWSAFLGEAPQREFDANRFINWRFYWDYSGGNVYENFVHQLGFWFKVLDLPVPDKVTMNGGVYLWKDGREVPDAMNVCMQFADREMLLNWTSSFGNQHFNYQEYVLGTHGTIHKQAEKIRYLPEKVNRRDGVEIVGDTPDEDHMRNFVDAIRVGRAPNCPFEIGFRTSIACRMCVDSYRQGRTLTWDREKEVVL